MAAKPELSAAQGIQNVVVYVSNDNFAQAYAVGQQNVAQGAHPVIQNGTYPPHSMATVGPSKCFIDKVKSPEYQNNGLVQQQGGFFSNNAVISQNGFSVNNLAEYQNINVLNQIKNVSYTGNNELLPSGDRQSGPGRPAELNKVREECDYLEAGCIVMGGEGQSVRCDSVRSEAAESSCSSLSSTDEGLVVVPQAPDMVVYDSSVSVRHGGVVLTVGPNGGQPQTQSSAPIVGTIATAAPITVPFGWKRILSNGTIIYIRYVLNSICVNKKI